MTRTLSILGSTGSIGTQSLEVLAAHHPEVCIAYLSTNTKVQLLAEQVQKVKVQGVAIRDERAAKRFREISDFKGEILVGDEGVAQAASYAENDLLLSALVGFSGVIPTLAAIRQGTTVALANKETLVSAGSVITQAAKDHGVDLIAVDSEHSAILQCLVGESPEAIEKLTITASGGPFRNHSVEQLNHVRVEDALKHPNWSMGAKITIDSSTLMNKGFEVIEAKWLFDVPSDRIDVVVHPQSIVHSFVTFVDGSVKAQLGLPDMKLPIHYALSYPRRRCSEFPRLSIQELGNLTFEQADVNRFPCLALAFEALSVGGTATAVLNAANEIAVSRFLERSIRFTDIPRIVEDSLRAIHQVDHPSLSQIIEHDAAARERAAAYTSSL